MTALTVAFESKPLTESVCEGDGSRFLILAGEHYFISLCLNGPRWVYPALDESERIPCQDVILLDDVCFIETPDVALS